MKKVVWAGLLALVMSAAALAQPKVLRYAFRGAETGFDPARVSDSYSNIVNTAMFDAPLRWAYLARPFRMEPAGCELPEVSADFRTITLKVRPGIFFADDPAFKGRKRELVAADYVYSIKRHYDPATNSPNLYIFESAQLLGLSELRRKALRDKKPFEYDTPVEGLKVLDKYTWQIRLGKRDPRFVDNLTNPLAAALAREVVEHYGDKTPQHPVGTAAFMLKQDEWRRSSRIVLVKNPNFRDEFYAEQAPAERPDLQALAQRLKGRKLPMVDRVEIAIIEEPQPRWLSFLGREAELIQELPGEFTPVAIPHGQLAPNLAARGIQQMRYVNPDINHVFFNLKDPVVGGYSAAQVALRRALSLAYRQRAGDPARAARPDDAGAGPDATRHLGLRPVLQEQHERAQPGQGQGPAGPARLQGPRRRRLARAARRQRRCACVMDRADQCRRALARRDLEEEPARRSA
jgi:ABC-type transport system substrate-binding protein